MCVNIRYLFFWFSCVIVSESVHISENSTVSFFLWLRCWEGLGAGGEGDDRRWDGWMASLTRWTWVSKLQELVMFREAWRAAIHGVARSRTRLRDWTELNIPLCICATSSLPIHLLMLFISLIDCSLSPSICGCLLPKAVLLKSVTLLTCLIFPSVLQTLSIPFT